MSYAGMPSGQLIKAFDQLLVAALILLCCFGQALTFVRP